MAVLTVQQIARAGIVPSFAAAAGGGDSFPNTGSEYVEVVNGDVADKTVTFVTPNTVDSLAIADRPEVVAAGTRQKFGPFPTGTYNDSNDRVGITYSAVTNLTIGVFKI